VRVGSDITFVVLAIKGRQVRIGIEAPAQVRILRGELHDPVAKSGAAGGGRPGELVPAGEHRESGPRCETGVDGGRFSRRRALQSRPASKRSLAPAVALPRPGG
jgi:hypothetical protein